VLHQEALAQELWLGLLFTEILWMLAGILIMTWSKKAGLLKATLSEINKYSLKQLREALHAIETDEKRRMPHLN
jgi:hypothetical protein